jgi:apolipoprotein N-acyltransferase
MKDFSAGKGGQTVSLPQVPELQPLICYEVIFPEMSKAPEGKHPKWLLNLTNDGWYGESTGPYQHFYIAKMRAVEQGLPMVRAANNGISAVIDSYGRTVASLPLNAVGILETKLPKPSAY